MKFNGQLDIESCPDISIEVKSEPLSFSTHAKGSLVGQVSSIAVQVEEIPIHLVIPFLRRPGHGQKIASIGSFGIKFSPFSVAIEGANVHLEGVLGTKGISCHLDGRAGCKSKATFNGKLFGKIANFSADLPDDEFEESVDAI